MQWWRTIEHSHTACRHSHLPLTSRTLPTSISFRDSYDSRKSERTRTCLGWVLQIAQFNLCKRLEQWRWIWNKQTNSETMKQWKDEKVKDEFKPAKASPGGISNVQFTNPTTSTSTSISNKQTKCNSHLLFLLQTTKLDIRLDGGCIEFKICWMFFK